MSDSETSDEDFRPEEKEESEEDSECGEEEEVEDNEIAAAPSCEQKRMSRRGCGKTEDNDVEKDELESDEEDKSRTEALWKDFLSDVKPETSAKSLTKKTTASDTKTATTKSVEKVEEKEEEKKKTTEENMKTKRTSLTSLESPLPSKIKRTFGSGGGGGLSVALSITQKQRKKSILDSSLQDWKSFKDDEGLQEQLTEYNKGKDGYLDRQDFLKRTDYRQFEIEKNLRRNRFK